MKKLIPLALILLLLFPSFGCAKQPHELSYDELMSLKKYENHLYEPSPLVHHNTLLENLNHYNRRYAYIEGKCLTTRFFVYWNEETQTLSDAYARQEIRITNIAHAQPFFSEKLGSIITIKGNITLTLQPENYDYSDTITEEEQVQLNRAYIDFLCRLGATIDSDTEQISLATGEYEFVPMSDMPLAIVYTSSEEIPFSVPLMNEGEKYTMFIHERNAGIYTAQGTYPATQDSRLFQNNFYGFSHENLDNVQQIADVVNSAKGQ